MTAKKRSRFSFFPMALLFAATWSAGAQAAASGDGPRFALVIGNSQYDSLGALKNPVNDATDMAAALTRLGFDVELLTDAELSDMESAVVRLKNRLSTSAAATGLFFYAGHGVQSNGINYLIPVHTNITDEAFLKSKALASQAVLDLMQDAGNRLNLIFLDACRDNPFAWSRGGSRGLSVVSVQPRGSIVVYATSAGSVALDGDGRNGVFTSELLKHIETRGIDLNTMLDLTAQGVLKATLSRQNPAIYKQYFQTTYLAGGEGEAVAAVAVSVPETSPAREVEIPVSTFLDPGAEAQPVTKNGWKQVSGDWSVARGSDEGGIKAASGANFFWSGKSLQGELTQDVDIKTLLDTLGPGATIRLAGSLASYKADADTSRMVLELYDAGGSLLKSADSGAQNYDTWTRVELTSDVPSGATIARVRLLTRRVSGTDNNGYFDDLSLTISGVTKAAPASRPASLTAKALPAAEPPKPVAITTELGYFAADGEIAEGDFQKGAFTYDRYTLAGKKGDGLTITAAGAGSFSPTLVLTSPAGVVARGTAVLKSTLRETGNYTLDVGANGPTRPQTYSLVFKGPGTDYDGSVDWTKDQRRTFEGYYDSVDVDMLQGGWYSVELLSHTSDTKVILEDTKGNPWPTEGGAQSLLVKKGDGNATLSFHNVGDGTMRILIMDVGLGSINNDDWRLRVTMTGMGDSPADGGR